MPSTLLELAGFAAIVAATILLAGVAAGLYVAGAELLLVGYAMEDDRALVALRRPVSLARGRVRRRRLAQAE